MSATEWFRIWTTVENILMIVSFPIVFGISLLIVKMGGTNIRKPPTRNIFIIFASFSVGVFLEINYVQVTIGMNTGLPNLAWLLAWMFITTTIYYIGRLGCDMREIPYQDWLRYLWYGVLALQCAIYILHIRFMPENPTHPLPHTAPMLVFMLSLFVFGIIVYIPVIRSTFQRFDEEETPLAKARIGIGLFSHVFSILFFIFRALAYLAGYFGEIGLASALFGFSLLNECLGGLVLGVPLLPRGVLLRVNTLLTYPQNLFYFWGLSRLQIQVNLFVKSPYGRMKRSKWQEFLYTPMSCYQKMLSDIMDCKFLLKQLNIVFDEDPNRIADLKFVRNLNWLDPLIQRQVKTLSYALQQIDDDLQLKNVLRAYAVLGLKASVS